MGKIVRYITTDGSAFVIAGDTTDMVSKAENIHKTSAVTTAALGRLMTAASMMGVMLKGKAKRRRSGRCCSCRFGQSGQCEGLC